MIIFIYMQIAWTNYITDVEGLHIPELNNNKLLLKLLIEHCLKCHVYSIGLRKAYNIKVITVIDWLCRLFLICIWWKISMTAPYHQIVSIYIKKISKHLLNLHSIKYWFLNFCLELYGYFPQF